jgi:hypothetical protein
VQQFFVTSIVALSIPVFIAGHRAVSELAAVTPFPCHSWASAVSYKMLSPAAMAFSANACAYEKFRRGGSIASLVGSCRLG